jgi:hypothetical protein
MFVHTVYFWLKDKSSQANREKLHAGIQSLTSIDVIQQAYVGVPASTRREVIDSSYDFSITFIFENKEKHDAYQVHPTHLKFVETCRELWAKVQVYDAVPSGK